MKVTLLGLGTVGIGFVRALTERSDLLATRGMQVQLVAVADSRSAAVDRVGLDPGRLLARKKTTGRVGDLETDGAHIIREVESDVVIELTPGNPKGGEPALTHIREALNASKHVISANKMPLALRYSELMEEATRRQAMLLYSACVGGGIPILEIGRGCAEIEEVSGFDAVLNATSNFILSKMEDEGTDYETALAEAQRLGYAEADPSLDVDGMDAAAKLTIMANHVMGKRITLGDVHPLLGIRRVTPESVKAATSRGRSLRAVASMHGTATVGPREVDASDPLDVHGATNVAVFHCRDSGDRVIGGASGGGAATSRAVLRDLAAIARAMGEGGLK